MGLFQADLGGYLHLRRHLWPVPHAVSVVPALPPCDRDERNQGRVTSAESTGERSPRMSLSFLDKLPLPAFLKPAAGARHYGVVGDFASPEDLLRAIRTLRTAGFTKLEAYSPFPIHGIDEALGEPRSPLGRIVFVAAMLGLASAIALQWWTGAVDY